MASPTIGTSGPPPAKKKLTVVDWFNILGVIVGIATAIPVVIAAIRVTGTLSSTYRLLASGELISQISEAEKRAVANVQKAGLDADKYNVRITRDSAANAGFNALRGRNLGDIFSTISSNLQDGETGCYKSDAFIIFCVRKGDYTQHAQREIVGASIGPTTGSGSITVTSYFWEIEPTYFVISLFRNQPDWINITDGANQNAPFEFRTDITIFTKPATKK